MEGSNTSIASLTAEKDVLAGVDDQIAECNSNTATLQAAIDNTANDNTVTDNTANDNTTTDNTATWWVFKELTLNNA